jgi:hypothetical protein
MLINMREHINDYKKLDIRISYSGPMWEDGIVGLAEVVKTSLGNDDLPSRAAKAVFSVFVEQVTNMLMYSAERESYAKTEKEEAATGMLVLGNKGRTYFIQTGNAIRNDGVDFIKSRIDYLNTLDKRELRQYHKERMREDNDNPESKGAGLGLIEIARRASAPIEYTFESINETLSYFSMYVEITQEGEGH